MRWENGHDERALWEMQACAEQLREPYLRVYALLICIRSMKQKEQDQAISLCEVLTACQLPDVAHQAACLLEEMKGGSHRRGVQPPSLGANCPARPRAATCLGCNPRELRAQALGPQGRR